MLNELKFSFGIVGGDVNVASKTIPTEKEKTIKIFNYGGNQMQQKPIPLAVIDGEPLMDKRLPKRSFFIETLLPEGISMLGGAPKIGKSWMVLDIGIRVAKGEPIWNLPTKLCTSRSRIHSRGFRNGSASSPTMFPAICSSQSRQAHLPTIFAFRSNSLFRSIATPFSSSSTPFRLFAWAASTPLTQTITTRCESSKLSQTK